MPRAFPRHSRRFIRHPASLSAFGSSVLRNFTRIHSLRMPIHRIRQMGDQYAISAANIHADSAVRAA
ncbi:hypothetical protein BURPS305_1047 [Burkholderia pseudomallei 305]|nr:hypothetical protein BPC006_I1695 [Burkholderia pseudomallei BPC006]EBA45911.1 hypothetical protein BURPS305_1047 [Burkholderia pseudomallei 305]